MPCLLAGVEVAVVGLVEMTKMMRTKMCLHLGRSLAPVHLAVLWACEEEGEIVLAHVLI